MNAEELAQERGYDACADWLEDVYQKLHKECGLPDAAAKLSRVGDFAR